MKPLVSVIITTKNEEKNIENCLKSIRNQTYKNIEIIVVDNNSTDKTKEIAKKYTDKVFKHGPERSAQRNFGAKMARGKYILYLDADMILSPGVIKECVEKMEKNNNLVALYIPERIIGEGFWIKVRDFERSFYTATPIDAVRFIRKEVFEKVGGFDENLTGPEDWDFDKKVRSVGKVDVINSCLYHNEGKFNLRNYVKKKLYYAKSFDKYIKKWGNDDPDIKKQLGAHYRLIGVFIENGKWKKLMKKLHLTLGMTFLRCIVGITYLLNNSISKIKGGI